MSKISDTFSDLLAKHPDSLWVFSNQICRETFFQYEVTQILADLASFEKFVIDICVEDTLLAGVSSDDADGRMPR